MTPSSSAGLSISMIPVVAHTVAFLGERPSAKAFGMRVLAMAIFGLGRSACTQRRSIIACSSGACGGRDLLGAHRGQRHLVRGEQLQQGEAHRDREHDARADAGGEERADEHDVDRAEQEHDRRHPDLEAGVATE